MTEQITSDALEVGVPMWATESSLKIVTKQLESMGAKSEEVIKATQNLEKTVKKEGENSEATAEALKNVAKQLKDSSSSTDTKGAPDPGTSALSQRFEKLRGTMKDVTGEVLEDFNRNLMRGSYQLGTFGIPLRKAQGGLMDLSGKAGKLGKVGFPILAGAIGLATSTIGAMIRVVTDAAGTLKSLNNVGLIEIRNAAHLNRVMGDLGMTSDQLLRVSEEYSRELGTFGFDALQNLVAGSKEAEQSMYNLGLTLADASEFGAQYLKLQRLGGTFQSNKNVEEQENFANTMENLTAFSRILNVSRSEIMKVATEIMEDEFVRARIAGIQNEIVREQAADSMENMAMMFAALGPEGKKFGDLFAQGVGALDPMLIEDFQNMLPFAGEAAMEMMDMARRVAGGEEISVDESIKSLIRLEEALERQSGTISLYAAYGDAQAAQTMALLTTMRESRARYEQDERSRRMSYEQYLAEEEELAQGLARSGAALQSVFNRLRLRFQEALMRVMQVFTGEEGAEGIANALAGIIDSLGNMLLEFSETLQGVVEQTGGLPAVMSEGLGRAVEIILRSLGDQLAKSENSIVRGLGRALGGARSPEARAIREIEDQLPGRGAYEMVGGRRATNMSRDEYYRFINPDYEELTQRRDLLRNREQLLDSDAAQAVMAGMSLTQQAMISQARRQTLEASDPTGAFIRKLEESQGETAARILEIMYDKEKRENASPEQMQVLYSQAANLEELVRLIRRQQTE